MDTSQSQAFRNFVGKVSGLKSMQCHATIEASFKGQVAKIGEMSLI